MLTKQDLKAIGNLIDDRLDKKLEEKLETKLEEKLETKLEPIRTEIKVIKAHNIRVEYKLDKMELKFDKNLKKWKSELFNKIDPVLNRVTKAEEENVILKAREEERAIYKNKFNDHDKRIQKLENQVFA